MRNRFLILMAGLAGVLTLSACNTTTKITGVVDPAYRGNYQVNQFVVAGRGMDLDEKRALDNAVAQSLQSSQVRVIRGLNVLPLSGNISDATILSAARKNGADAVLIVTASNKNIVETYVPPTYHPAVTTSEIETKNGKTTIVTKTVPAYTTGDYYLKKPQMNVSAKLLDVKNKRIIWQGEGFSSGNSNANFTMLAASTGQEAVRDLSAAGLLQGGTPRLTPNNTQRSFSN